MTFIDWIRSHPCEVVGFSLLITLCVAAVVSVVMSFLRDKYDEMLSRGWSSPEEVAEIGRKYREDLVAKIRPMLRYLEERRVVLLMEGDTEGLDAVREMEKILLHVIEIIERDGK